MALLGLLEVILSDKIRCCGKAISSGNYGRCQKLSRRRSRLRCAHLNFLLSVREFRCAPSRITTTFATLGCRANSNISRGRNDPVTIIVKLLQLALWNEV